MGHGGGQFLLVGGLPLQVVAGKSGVRVQELPGVGGRLQLEEARFQVLHPHHHGRGIGGAIGAAALGRVTVAGAQAHG